MPTEEAAPAVAPAAETRSKRSARTDDIELAVLVLADGARPDVLQALCASGDLPNIAGYLLEPGSYHDGVTVLPSVTNVAYLPMLTGQYPGPANMPGIRWVDKSRFTPGSLFPSGHRSYIGPTHLCFNGDLSHDMETLFELSPGSLAVRSDIHRGLPSRRNRFHGISIPFMFFSHYLRRADFIDRIGLGALTRALTRADGDLPRLVFLPLLDIDTASHGYGPHHKRTVDAYRRVDSAIGALIGHLKRLGAWERTHLLVSSDHGHSETSVHLDLSGLISELGYKVFQHPSLFRTSANAAVGISGNSFANVYVASEDRWEGPSVGQELEGEHGRLLEALRHRPEIEWIAYRHAGGTVKIASSSGTALLGFDGASYAYRFDGSDPMQLGLPHTTVPRSEALKLTYGTQFPDALEQISQLFTSPRTGDIIVTSRPGYDLRGWRELPEHRSSHGALCKEQMRVPVLSNRPLSHDGPMRTADLFPTIVESLDLTPSKPYPGRSLW